MSELVRAAFSLLPVLLFLVGLIFLDSYKLVRLGQVLRTVLIGAGVAILSLLLNSMLLNGLAINYEIFTRYLAPLIEESLKFGFVIFLIHSKRAGFLVDVAIYGFAVGTGFALVENVYYLLSLSDSSLLLWLVRGFGTAAMHGGTTAIAGIVSKYLSDRYGDSVWSFLPGLLLATVIHSAYNHFFLPPVAATLVLLIVQPLLIIVFYEQSEKATQHWLGSGLDADLKTYEAITRGKILETKIGAYLESLNDHFSYKVVADLLDYLRIHMELSMQAKGILLARKSGVKAEPDPEVKGMFQELAVLEKRIGPTGKLAIVPFLRRSSRDLWEIHMLTS